MREIVNKPYISHWIGGLYIVLLIYVSSVWLYILFELSLTVQVVFNGVMFSVFTLVAVITIGLYYTRYRIKDGVLSSYSPFMIIKVKLNDIKKVEKVMVPFHFRIGASFYSGVFYVPNFGWVRTIMTNMRDAILITTKDGKHYMITPSNPKRFMKKLKS